MRWQIFVAVFVVVIGLAGIVIYLDQGRGTGNELVTKITGNAGSKAEQAGRELAGECSGTGAGQLTHSAMDPEDFAMMIPYGLMVGGHVTPIDHQYYSPVDYNSPRDSYPVYAMGDARLVQVQHRTEQPQDNQKTRQTETSEYRLVFSQSCTFFYYYDLLTSLTPDLLAQVGNEAYASVDIPVKAGQLIGYIGGQTLDFAVWDTEKPLSGFLIPEHYTAEAWKLYTADPLDYYTAELKATMLAKYPRVDEPLSGKIDWDVDGALRGTWFEEGTNYLEGDRSNPKGEWVGHLSFAPDLYDPSRWIVSMGDYPVAQDSNTQVSATQFHTKVGSPNPEDITKDDGLVKLELVHENYMKADGTQWRAEDGFAKGPKVGTSNRVLATALVQLTDTRVLKFEVFPNKTAADVTGFTANAKTYTR